MPKKTARIEIRVLPEEKRAITRMAKTAKKSVSQYIVFTLTKKNPTDV